MPLHLPVRKVLDAHTVFVHAAHVPFLVASDPTRYSSILHTGWSRHVPLLVLLATERYCDDLQTGWSAQLPFVTAEAEARN